MSFARGRRFSSVSVESVGDDHVAFISDTMSYHAFSHGAYQVWQLADGMRSDEELAELVYGDRSDDSVLRVRMALDELAYAELLEGVEPTDAALLDRRRVAKVLAATVLGGVGIPMVSSITAPTAAQGLSSWTATLVPDGQGCAPDTPESNCASGCCCYWPDFGAEHGVCYPTEAACRALEGGHYVCAA